MIFQEVLSKKNASARPLQSFRDSGDPISAFADHWKFILDKINYHPIFFVAHKLLTCLAADPLVTLSIRQLLDSARRIVDWRAALRHDLAGRLYHRLLSDAKYLGAYYTSIPSSVLLLKLALRPERWKVDWSNLDAIGSLRIADLACGTGTLLMAASDAVIDNLGGCLSALEPVSITPGLLISGSKVRVLDGTSRRGESFNDMASH